MLPWQQQERCHSVSFVMCICGPKFEEHCSNISRDILDSVFYRSSGTIDDVITFLVCMIQKRTKYLQNEKRYSKKENALLLYFEKPFK